MQHDDKDQEKLVKAARKAEALREKNVDDVIAVLMDQAQGRDFLWWLLEIGKIGLQPFSGNALSTSFNCGELNVGQQMLARFITVSPAGYVRMLEEKNDAGRPEPTASDTGDSAAADS